MSSVGCCLMGSLSRSKSGLHVLTLLPAVCFCVFSSAILFVVMPWLRLGNDLTKNYPSKQDMLSYTNSLHSLIGAVIGLSVWQWSTDQFKLTIKPHP